MQVLAGHANCSMPSRNKFGINLSSSEFEPIMPLKRRLSDRHLQEITTLISDGYYPGVPKKYQTNEAIAERAGADRIERLTKENGEYFVQQHLELIKAGNATADDVNLVKDGVLRPSLEYRKQFWDPEAAVSDAEGCDFESPEPHTLSPLNRIDSARSEIHVDTVPQDIHSGLTITAAPATISTERKKQSLSLQQVRTTAEKSYTRSNWYLAMPQADGTRSLISPFQLDANKRTIRVNGKPIPNPPTDVQLTNEDTTHAKPYQRAGTPGNRFTLPNGKQLQHEDPDTGNRVVTKRVLPKKEKK